jgi:hypothetical protein
MSAYTDPPTTLTSNPSAPSSLPRLLATPLSITTTIIYLAILGPYLLYQTITYYAFGPPCDGWSLCTMLFTRGLGLLLRFSFWFGLPQADGNAAGVPIGARRKGVRVDCRVIEGIPKGEEEELRIGWVKQRDVKVVDYPRVHVITGITEHPTDSTPTIPHHSLQIHPRKRRGKDHLLSRRWGSRLWPSVEDASSMDNFAPAQRPYLLYVSSFSFRRLLIDS